MFEFAISVYIPIMFVFIIGAVFLGVIMMADPIWDNHGNFTNEKFGVFSFIWILMTLLIMAVFIIGAPISIGIMSMINYFS